jgi:hypothetical protein
MKFFVILLLIPAFSLAAIDIAFLEFRDNKGQLIQLEPKGRFAHIAISYKGQWLHSHPYQGVEIVTQDGLEKIGTIKAIITISKTHSLRKTEAEIFLGKPYDSKFSWSDDKIYCSELVAKLLKIEPQPMKFETDFWSEHYKSLNGQLGISPDDIFLFLKEKGYKTRFLNSN